MRKYLKSLRIWVLLALAVLVGRWASQDWLAGPALVLEPPQASALHAALGSAGDPPVTVFLTEWCPYCRALEADLHAKGVRFARVDIEKTEVGMRYFSQLSTRLGPGIPVTVVGDEVFRGYAPGPVLRAARKVR